MSPKTLRLLVLNTFHNFPFKMVEAVGIEPTSTAAKIKVIHKHSWFVIALPTKLGSYNLSLTALLQ